MSTSEAEKGRGEESIKTIVDANGNVVQQPVAQPVVQQPVVSVAEKGRDGAPVATTGGTNGAVAQQPTGQQPAVQQPAAETKPKYKFGWGKEGATFGSVIRGEAKDVPIEQVLPDYLQYARDNDVPVDYVSLYSAMKDRDVSKSYNENEKEKKKQQMSDMWEGIGNVLVSFANFGGALAGAPEPTNLKDPAELTARQRALRDKTLAQRRAYNKDVFEMMKQQQADEYKKNNYDLKLRQQEWKEKMEQGKLDYNKEAREAEQLAAAKKDAAIQAVLAALG